MDKFTKRMLKIFAVYVCGMLIFLFYLVRCGVWTGQCQAAWRIQ